MKLYPGVALLVLVAVGATPSQGSEAGKRARFRILVPEEAFVFVARERMQATGTVRLFESPPLRQGRRYTYEISVIHEGREVVRTVRFEPGRTVEVDFRKELEKLSDGTGPTGKPLKPIRPVWLPGRVWRA
jgi:uncharacterized protein (TIGR03000 family)